MAGCIGAFAASVATLPLVAFTCDNRGFDTVYPILADIAAPPAWLPSPLPVADV